MKKDYGFGVISVEKELTNKEFLSKLDEADNKMKTNLLEGFEKLRQENKQLKEQLAIREKALELACKSLTYYYNLENIEYGIDGNYNKLEIYNNLIEQAKENIDGKINN